MPRRTFIHPEILYSGLKITITTGFTMTISNGYTVIKDGAESSSENMRLFPIGRNDALGHVLRVFLQRENDF